jgi:uncharacterized protein YjbI with pentapeptide repeats
MDIAKDTQLIYSERTFTRMNVVGQTISGKEFEKCVFEKCSFLESTFSLCRFIDCIFSESMLSAIKCTSSIFLETVFKKSKVMGIDWSRAKKIRGLEFINCELNLSGFSFTKLPNLVMKNCTAKDVNFMEADCSNADFEGTDFENSIFQQTNLSGANFKRAFNYAIDCRYNTLKKTKFSMPEAASLLRGLDIVLED